jgi:hypothetical protein
MDFRNHKYITYCGYGLLQVEVSQTDLLHIEANGVVQPIFAHFAQVCRDELYPP